MAEPRPPGGRPSQFDQDYEEVTSVTAPPTIEGRRLNVPTAPSRATLTLVSGPNAGAMYPLLLDESVIGRTRDCAIRIDDPGISRRHARIVRRGPEAYFLEDLGSRVVKISTGNEPVTCRPASSSFSLSGNVFGMAKTNALANAAPKNATSTHHCQTRSFIRRAARETARCGAARESGETLAHRCEYAFPTSSTLRRVTFGSRPSVWPLSIRITSAMTTPSRASGYVQNLATPPRGSRR